MTRFPVAVRRTILLGLAGLALSVPFSAPDGTGMQWDETVLFAVACSAAWTVLRRARAMEPRAARPWLVIGGGALVFAVSQLLTAAFPGPAFDGFGVDDVILFAGASSPLVTCALLARRVPRTRWTALVVDGLTVTASLYVVFEIVATLGLDPTTAPVEFRSLVLAYGGYAAVMLGVAIALCTVSTRDIRRSATIMIFAVAFQSAAAACEAMAIVAPTPLWTGASDVAVALGLQTAALAALAAPDRFADRRARAAAPQVSVAGMAVVLVGLLTLPVALGISMLRHQPLTTVAEIGCGVVFVLMALRVVLRIREAGRIAEDLVRSEEDFRGLVESSSDGVAIVDEDLHLLFTSPAARSLLGIRAEAAAEEIDLVDLVDAEDRALVRATLERNSDPVFHFHIRRSDERLELEATTSERPGSDRRVLYLRDVTVRRRRERELERMAYTDHLTGLPNRAQLFGDMAAAAAAGGHCLLVLDLDGFKAVNDLAGHETGDQLLVEVARRLHTVVREDDLVARLGGDEFAVLVAGDLEESVEVAQRVVDALGLPYRTGDWTFAVGASVGVAALHVAGGQLAFREADAALRAAKQAGKGCVRVADGDLASAVSMSSDLAAALADDSVHVRFDAATAPDGGLALVHAVPVWQHAVHGTVRGQELWGAAERQGHSATLQEWLLRQACSEVAEVDDVLTVVVSLPAGHVTPDGLAATVARALAATGLPTSRLILSLTEETLLTSSAALVPELEAVRRSGVRLCLDNFGMGQSLFALLARVSLDTVRVDLAALGARDDTERALQVLNAIARSCTDFDVSVIAGGVSTPELREAALVAGAALLHGRGMPHDMTRDDLALALAVSPVATV